MKGRGNGAATGSTVSDRWKHPSGVPLADIRIGDPVDGVVTNTTRLGVFVNFGAVKDGLLRVSGGRPALRRGEELRGLVVAACDISKERVVLEFPDDDKPAPSLKGHRQQDAGATQRSHSASALPPAEDKAGARGGKARGRSSDTRSPPAAAKEALPSHVRDMRRIPLEELPSGIVVTARVKTVGPFGVFLDIGAEGDARLRCPARVKRMFRRGDVLDGCHIDWVDPQLRRIQASIDDERLQDRSDDAPEHRKNQERQESPPPLQQRQQPQQQPQRPQQAQQTQQAQQPQLHWQQAVSSRVPQHMGSTGIADQVHDWHAWDHQRRSENSAGAIPTEDIREGDVVDGFVTLMSRDEVFVDIGGGRTARLDVPRRVEQQLRRGDEVIGMVVSEAGRRSGCIVVTIEDPKVTVAPTDFRFRGSPEYHWSEPATVQQPAAVGWGAGRWAGGWGGSQPSRPPQPRDRERTCLEDIEFGAEVAGFVTRLGPNWALLDFGAVRDGLLHLAARDAQKLQLGDCMEGLVVDMVDLDREEVHLALTYELGEAPCESARGPGGSAVPFRSAQAGSKPWR